jgi:hypothetical protein
MKLRYALPLAYVGVIAGIGAWLYLDPKGLMSNTRAGRKKIEKATGARLPRPDIVIHGPVDTESFDDFDYVLCEAVAEVNIENPGLRTDDETKFISSVATRALGKLFPDYPWPATSGDHPSAAEIQGLVKYEVRRGMVDQTLCIVEPNEVFVEPEDQTETDDENDFFLPPGA